jgi:hypothetical protein
VVMPTPLQRRRHSLSHRICRRSNWHRHSLWHIWDPSHAAVSLPRTVIQLSFARKSTGTTIPSKREEFICLWEQCLFLSVTAITLHSVNPIETYLRSGL